MTGRDPGEDAIGAREFDRLMDALGPFEAAPHVAAAVSGGADSMALCLLAHAWAGRRGGALTALIVDHGLREGSGAEARRVAAWLAARGIEHRVLRRRGPRPARNVQAAARAARYDLLTGWCRRHHVLHLLLGHHLEDQAETLLLRLGRGSGVDGLAAMAPVRETMDVRLLRPLLNTPRARLAATLRRRRQPWIDDPANRDTAHARVRLRRLMPALAGEGLGADRLAATARRMARARAALEAATARALARAVALHPSGFCRVDTGALATLPVEVGLRVLRAVIVTTGGATYPPRLDRLERLYAAAVAGGPAAGRTLGGCRILPERPGLLVCREPAAARDVVAARPGRTVRWDGRFALAFRAAGEGAPAATVSRLGRAGWAEVVARTPALRGTALPFPVRLSLPAVRDAEGVLMVPHLHYGRPGRDPASLTLRALRFEPARPLGSGEFPVVWTTGGPIS